MLAITLPWGLPYEAKRVVFRARRGSHANIPTGSNRKIRSVPKSGNPITDLAIEQPATRGIAVDNGRVYWASDGDPATQSSAGIWSVPKGGGTSVLVSTDNQGAWGVAADAGCVYRTNPLNYYVRGTPKSGATGAYLAPNLGDATTIFVDDTGLYWATGSSVVKIPK